jgi:hypothetical protein
LNDTGTTDGWLDSITQLKSIDRSKALEMSHKLILEGTLQKKRKVVVKIADVEEDLEHEWSCSRKLADPRNVNFLKYFCFFRCNDRLPRIIEKAIDGRVGIGICQGKGDSMQVLLMEHVESGSMKRYDWSRHPIAALQDFIVQAVFALLNAHLSCGFSHGDFHIDNVLVAKTSRSHVTYDQLPGSPYVETHGLLAKLMDFELSKFGMQPVSVFKDLQEFFGKSLNDLALFATVAPLQECSIRLRDWAEQSPPCSQNDLCKAVLSLVPIIRKLEAVPRPAPPMNGGAKKKNEWDGPKKKPATPNIARKARKRS